MGGRCGEVGRGRSARAGRPRVRLLAGSVCLGLSLLVVLARIWSAGPAFALDIGSASFPIDSVTAESPPGCSGLHSGDRFDWQGYSAPNATYGPAPGEGWASVSPVGAANSEIFAWDAAAQGSGWAATGRETTNFANNFTQFSSDAVAQSQARISLSTAGGNGSFQFPIGARAGAQPCTFNLVFSRAGSSDTAAPPTSAETAVPVPAPTQQSSETTATSAPPTSDTSASSAPTTSDTSQPATSDTSTDSTTIDTAGTSSDSGGGGGLGIGNKFGLVLLGLIPMGVGGGALVQYRRRRTSGPSDEQLLARQNESCARLQSWQSLLKGSQEQVAWDEAEAEALGAEITVTYRAISDEVNRMLSWRYVQWAALNGLSLYVLGKALAQRVLSAAVAAGDKAVAAAAANQVKELVRKQAEQQAQKLTFELMSLLAALGPAAKKAEQEGESFFGVDPIGDVRRWADAMRQHFDAYFTDKLNDLKERTAADRATLTEDQAIVDQARAALAEAEAELDRRQVSYAKCVP